MNAVIKILLALFVGFAPVAYGQAGKALEGSTIDLSRPNQSLSSGTGTVSRLNLWGNSSGYVDSAVFHRAYGGSARGAGSYSWNDTADTTWFWGNPYSTSDEFRIMRKGTSTSLEETAADSATGTTLGMVTGAGAWTIGVAGQYATFPGGIRPSSGGSTISGFTESTWSSTWAFDNGGANSASAAMRVWRLNDMCTLTVVLPGTTTSATGNATYYFNNTLVPAGFRPPADNVMMPGPIIKINGTYQAAIGIARILTTGSIRVYRDGTAGANPFTTSSAVANTGGDGWYFTLSYYCGA